MSPNSSYMIRWLGRYRSRRGCRLGAGALGARNSGAHRECDSNRDPERGNDHVGYGAQRGRASDAGFAHCFAHGLAGGCVAGGGAAAALRLRLWASVCLALYVAFWLELDNAYWAGTTAAIVCQPHLGASLRKGWFRMIGTVIGAVAIVVLTACFPQDRAPFLVGLALWGAACALVATLLRNFAAYAAALAGYTAAIIASDQLGATGGPNGQAFMLAVYRASEICIGIVCAGVVLAATDLGGARRRLATLFAGHFGRDRLPFHRHIGYAGAEFEQTQTIRRELVRRVIALDPVIDEAIGESSELRYHSPVLQNAVDGLLTALASWRTAAVLLARSPEERARREAGAVLAEVPKELRTRPEQDEATRWLADPDAPAAGHVTQRYAGSSPCRRERRRCGCSPTRRLKRWPAFRRRSTGWRCSLPIPPGGGSQSRPAACAYPIGCLRWSMPGARLS